MRIIVLLLACQFAWTLKAADAVANETTLVTRKHADALPLMAGPNDANITKVIARILENSHYLRQPLNDEASSRFLDRYLDSLDNLHIYFTATDLQEFEPFRATLDDLSKAGDTEPARIIFRRFLQRLQQQHDYVAELLQNEKFSFDTDERFVLNRRKLPRPKDLAEAKRFWRERVAYEYLQEKLSSSRPEVIGEVILEKLKENKPDEIAAGLKDKVSPEKAEAISQLVKEKLGREKPEAVVQAVLAKLEQDNVAEIHKVITRRYARILKTYSDFDNDDVLQVYLSALSHVYDPHSDYMGKSELENFSISMKLSLFGIGAMLGSEDGYCKIQSLVPGGPADRSKKLKAGDKIIMVAQSNLPPVDVVDMKLNKIVEQIRGPKGTEVRLTIVPADAPDPSVRREVALVREEIKLEDQEAKAQIIELPADGGKTVRLGVIDLPSFYAQFDLGGAKASGPPKSTTTDVAKLLRKLVEEKVAGVILDLRRNGGGSLDEAINLTGLFIKEGPVVQVKDMRGDIFEDRDENPEVAYDGPLVVLTSRFSASASEILAGALQDYGRALIVGDASTHGKGTVQSLIELGPIMRGQLALADPSLNPGALKITIRKFYRASGASTQLKGITPDIVLPSIWNHAEVGEDSLDNAMAWDTIPSASFDKVNRIGPHLAELKKRSETRIASDRDFAFLREEIERYKKSITDKSVSLNEAQRRKEKEEADARAKARKKELAARPEPPGKVYQITLKLAEQAGLPEPMARTNTVARVDGGPASEPQLSGADAAQPRKLEQKQPPTGGSLKTAELKPAGGKLIAAAASARTDEPSTPHKGLDPDEDSAADETSPALDITLEEAKRILMDLISLSQGKSALAVTVPAGTN